MSIKTEYSSLQLVSSVPSTANDTKGIVTKSKISFEGLRAAKESLCNVARKIQASQITRNATRIVSAVGAIALGLFTGFAIAGLAVTPALWCIFGGTLAVGLASSAACQNKTEFLKTLQVSVLSFGFGTGFGMMKAAHKATSLLGLSAPGVYFSGLAIYAASSLTYFLSNAAEK